jgi:hypothetical protein
VTGFVRDGVVTSSNSGTCGPQTEPRTPQCASVPFIVMLHWGRLMADLILRQDLWRKENFACVRIFYWASWRKTEDLDVTGIRRKRTGN